MKKEKHLWLKKLKFLLSSLKSKQSTMDIIKYSPLWLFKLQIFSLSIKNEEEANLLLSDDHKDKLLIYFKDAGFWGVSDFFKTHLCKNGSKEQILLMKRFLSFNCDDLLFLIDRFDEEFLEQLFKLGYNRFNFRTLSKLIQKEYEKALIALIGTFSDDTLIWWREDFEKLLFKSNLNKAKEAYFSVPCISEDARLQLISTHSFEKIEQIIEKKCNIDDCIALVKTNDEKLQMLGVKLYLEHQFENFEFTEAVFASNNKKAICEFIKTEHLSADEELSLVKNVDDEIIKFYILENENIDILSDVAMQYVFENRSLDLQEFIYSNMGLPYIQERNLIKSLDEEKICAYTSKFDLFVANECLLISTASKEIIEKYFSCNDLSESAEFCLIRRNEKDITNKYLNLLLQKENTEDKKLSRKALTEFISIGDIADIINYLQSRNACTYFTAKQSLLRGDEKLIEIHQKMLKSDIVRDVSKEATVSVLVKLFNNKNVKFDCYAQCDFCSREDIMLNTSADLIVNRNFDDDINFVKSTKILPPIAEFIKNHPLCAEAQELLFDDKFFNENVIRLYISLYELDENVLSSIINNAKFKDILNEYMEIHPLSDSLIFNMLN